MHCRDATAQLELYLDHAFSGPQADELRRHWGECEPCRRDLERVAQWRALLATLPVPEPSADFSERILATATQQRAPRRWSSPMVGAAVAASLVLGTGLGVWLPQQDGSPAAPTEYQAGTEALRTVRLVFDARRQLENVELTLELPSHVELAAFPGRQSVSWHVDLKPGQNVLALPLRVLSEGEGELIARLNDGEKRKVFRAMIQETLHGGHGSRARSS